MSFDVRWPRMSRWMRALVVLLSACAFVLDSTVLAVALVAAGLVWLVRGVRVRATGGGFRPMRYRDFIDLIAISELEAYEHEQAVAAAKAR